MAWLAVFCADEKILALRINRKVGIKTSKLPAELVAIFEVKRRANCWPKDFNEPR